MLGIGVITYKRFGAVAGCLACIKEYTTQEFKLVVADDGSNDPTKKYCEDLGVPVVGNVNHGVAYNVNRALYYLRDCDPIILLDSDIWPSGPDWQTPWIEAANIWGHVNYGFKHCPPIEGKGTPAEPFLCEHFGSGCVATSQSAFQAVGYQDPRFYEFPFSIAHAEWTFRFERHFDWRKATINSTPPCLQSGIELIGLGTYSNDHRRAISDSCLIMAGISRTESVYRHPWRSEEEKNLFLSE